MLHKYAQGTMTKRLRGVLDDDSISNDIRIARVHPMNEKVSRMANEP